MSTRQIQDTQLLQLLITFNGAKNDLEKITATKELFDFIGEHMDIIDTPELQQFTRETAEQILDDIDSILFFTDIDKSLLFDTQQSVSAVYYYEEPYEDEDELENDYLNTYLED